MSPIVADPTDVVSGLSDVVVDSTPSLAADLIDHDGGVGATGRIAVFRSIIRAERGLERREKTDEICALQITMRRTQVLARHRIRLEEVRRRIDRVFQPVDGRPRGPVFAQHVNEMLMPIKSAIRHVRQSN